MASSSQAVPATAAAIGSGTASITSQTIAGVHVFKIDNFSGTKDLGVGKSIESSSFRVGGYGWYIKCYPCGVDGDSDGWVSLFLCREDDHHGSKLLAECCFTLMESPKGYDVSVMIRRPDGNSRWGITDLIEREELESLLMDKDDIFRVRCTVYVWIDKFPALTQRDLATKTVAGSHLLTIDEYSKTRRAFDIDQFIESCSFRVGEYLWYIRLYPCGKKHADSITTCLHLDLNELCGNEEEVMVWLEMTLLTHAGQIVSSVQNFQTFTETDYEYACNFLSAMEHESSPLLQNTLHVRCDMAIVKGITAMPYLRRGIGGDLQGSQHVRGDVTFEVGGHLFTAHKYVLTTRCTAFMAEFFGPSEKDNADVTNQPVRIDDMEPKVFEALLHFIYTDALPELREEDKVGMAQGLLVAADRFAMERLKLICADLLCSCINDAPTAVTTLNLADKHGCRRLKEHCMKILMDHFAKVAP